MPSVLLSLFLLELGDFPMSRREPLGIKRRADRLAGGRRAAAPEAVVRGPGRAGSEPSVTIQPAGL